MPSPHATMPDLLREQISIPHSPVIPSEHTMRKYRVVIEDEKTGQEFVGFSGLNRVAVERIHALVNSVGAHELSVGKLPTGKNASREQAQWARDVAHVLDRKPPRAVPKRKRTDVGTREGR